VSVNLVNAASRFRSSQRLTITVAQSTLEALVERSSLEGRSISNLAAYLLESSLAQRETSLSGSQRLAAHSN
jgi:hypothetical protein